MTMFRKLALGLVAAASLSAAALAPTAASAKPFGFGGGWPHHHHHFGLGLGYVGVGDACLVSQPVLTPFGYRMRRSTSATDRNPCFTWKSRPFTRPGFSCPIFAAQRLAAKA